MQPVTLGAGARTAAREPTIPLVGHLRAIAGPPTDLAGVPRPEPNRLRRCLPMSIELATTIITLLQLYAGAGLAFGLVFVLRGAAALDPDAREGSWGFRMLVLPGCAALWPLLLLRWVRRAGPPLESSPHRRAARQEDACPPDDACRPDAAGQTDAGVRP